MRRSDRPPGLRPRRLSSRPPAALAPPPPPLPRVDPPSAPKLPLDLLQQVEAQSNSPTIPAPPLVPDEARRGAIADEGSLDGLDVSPPISDSAVPKAPLLPSLPGEEPTAPVDAKVTKRAIPAIPTPLQSDFTRELAEEIRRQAAESAKNDPSAVAAKPPAPSTIEPTQKRLKAPEPRRWPIALGIAACVLVGLGAVGFIQRVGATGTGTTTSTTSPPPSARASTTAPATHPPPAPTPSGATIAPAATTVAAPHPAGAVPRYQVRNARAALDRVAQDLPSCRTEKKGLWGSGGATVKFSPDGKVADIALGPPYRNAKEGQCVTDILHRADMGPFDGKAIPVSYEFFLPMAMPK